MRKTQLLAAVLLVGLIPGIVGAVFLARSQQQTRRKTLDDSLTQTMDAETSSLSGYFDEARKQVLLGARNSAWLAFYKLPGDRVTKLRAGGPVLDDINAALMYFEHLYP